MAIPKDSTLSIPQSSDYNLVVYCLDDEENPVDITGYSAEFTIKRTYQSSASIITATSETGEIVITGLEGKLTISLTHTLTVDLPDFLCVYDLILTTPDSQKLMLLRGKVQVLLAVT